MTTAPRKWGYWTRAKLQILDGYLRAFAKASQQSPERVYLDAFAGEGIGVDRLTGEEFPGSARIALEIANPPFTRLRYFELAERAQSLEEKLREDYPERDIRVYSGDCNQTIPQALSELAHVRRAPAFAFLDPDGMQLNWGTLETLASHRPGQYKVELWMLFPIMGLFRTLGDPTEADVQRATRLFGSDEWQLILDARRESRLNAPTARTAYVNLMRWRLESVLGYAQTHPLEIVNMQGGPLYDMIFATDHPAGTRIMTSIYAKAAGQIPAMRRAARDEARGALSLFDVEELEGLEAHWGYSYEPPISPDELL